MDSTPRAYRLKASNAYLTFSTSAGTSPVHQILTNEKYIGSNVWNRVSFKLKKKRVRNRSDMWIRAEGAFPAIVDRSLFDDAQAIIHARSLRLSNEEMLEALRDLFQNQGMLSGIVIDETQGVPSSNAFRCRFGSLLRAYSLVGYTPRRDYRYIEINRALRRLHPDMVKMVVAGLEQAGGTVQRELGSDLIEVNGEFSVSVVIVRCRHTTSGALRWQIRFDTGLKPGITVVIRMDANNRQPFDFYLFPWIDMANAGIRLAEDNGLGLDAYLFETLDSLYELAARTRITEAG